MPEHWPDQHGQDHEVQLSRQLSLSLTFPSAGGPALQSVAASSEGLARFDPASNASRMAAMSGLSCRGSRLPSRGVRLQNKALVAVLQIVQWPELDAPAAQQGAID